VTSFTQYPEPSNEDLQPSGFVGWVKKHLKLAIGLAVAIVVLIASLGIVGWVNGIQNDGFTRQQQVDLEYGNMQIELSKCLDNSMKSAQIAQAERDSLKDILVGTASARYPDGAGPANSQIAITAIHEAYPNVSDELFKQLMTIVVGCRNQFAGEQEKLRWVAINFNTWTQTGEWYEKPIRGSLFPDDRLKATGADGRVITGRAALEFITQPILTGDAGDATKTKTMPEQTLFPSATPSATVTVTATPSSSPTATATKKK